jgi:GAF domain-containing protein
MEIADQLTKIITSSSDPEELKNKIVKEVAITLNASQCFFIEYDSTLHNFKKIANMYSLERNVESLLGYDIEKNLSYIAVKLKYMKTFVIEDTDLFIKSNKLENTNEAKYFDDFEVKAFLAVRLDFDETFSGILALNYDEKKEGLKEKNLPLLVNIAEHLSIALHLSTLYLEEKRKSEREKLLRSIVSIMGESYNLDKINEKVFTILGNVYNAQSIFVNINEVVIKKFYFYNLSKSKTIEFDEKAEESLVKLYNLPQFDFVRSRLNYISNVHHFIISNNLENSSIEKYFNENNIKSLILLPIMHEFLSYGLLIVHFDIINPITKEDLELFRTIAIQLGIVIAQVLFYEKEKIALEREKILGIILNRSLSTFDIGQVKPIVKEVGILAKADRCYFVEANEEGKSGNQIHYDREYLASTDVKSAIGYEFPAEDVHKFVEMYLEAKDLIVFDYEEIMKQSETEYKGMQQYIRRFDVKSAVGIPLFYEGKLHAVLAIEYSKEKVLPTKDELEFYKILGKQANMVLNQIKLFEKTKKTAERERISRNIIEILRSSIDRKIIKKLFVKNIGKFFDANRVLLSEYDESIKMYRSADETSEYLSGDEKSLQGYDLTSPEVSVFMGPLLEKRELIINDIDEYIKQNQTPEEFISFCHNYNIKSSYNFPIVYQQNLMGFFCIIFSKEAKILSDEDIGRLRSMCTQAGITLYHADLYEKASDCLQSRTSFIKDIHGKIKKSATEILDISTMLTNTDIEHSREIIYLNKIINSCSQLLDLTKT